MADSTKVKNASMATAIIPDNVVGPLVYNPDSAIEVKQDTDFNAAGWVHIGYASTDGASFEQKADSTQKKVWGAVLGNSFSNFTDTATVSVASVKDPDSLGLTYGPKNVTTDATTGFTHVLVKSRQGTTGTWVIIGTTDDNSPVLWVYRGTSDPNISYKANDGDIVSFDLVITGAAAADGTTSEIWIQTSAPKPPDPPAAKTTTTASGVKVTATDLTVKVGATAPTLADFKASAVDKDGKSVTLTLDLTGVDLTKAGSYTAKLSDGVSGDDPVSVGLTVVAA